MTNNKSSFETANNSSIDSSDAKPTKLSILGNSVGALLVMLMEVPLIIFQAWVLTKVWIWYNLTTLGLPHITVSLAFGGILLLRLLHMAFKNLIDDRDEGFVGVIRASDGSIMNVDLKSRAAKKDFTGTLAAIVGKKFGRSSAFVYMFIVAWAGTFFL